MQNSVQGGMKEKGGNSRQCNKKITRDDDGSVTRLSLRQDKCYVDADVGMDVFSSTFSRVICNMCIVHKLVLVTQVSSLSVRQMLCGK